MEFIKYLLLAVFLLAGCTSVFGQERPTHTPEEIRDLTRLAEQGNAPAQYLLGQMYRKGEGVPKDYQLAVKWYKLAAEQGSASAQYLLGLMYDQGKGVPKDYQLAAKWYRKSAEKGDAPAQFNLALMYRKGEGVPKDYQLAVKWYKLAAEQGVADAQYNLGLMYDQGKGVPQDYILAHKWVNLAAAQGDKRVAEYRDLLAKRMTPSQILEAQKLAREFKPKKENPKK